MLTEDEARDLLERAAATIEVQPGAPIAAPARRRWVVPAVAAAAVAAAVLAGFVLIDRDPTGEVSPAPQITDRIPSVFAYRADQAERMLTDLGLRVRLDTKYGCEDARRAMRTEPRAGSRFEQGDSITLFVTLSPPMALCAATDRQLAWLILDFANKRGPAPSFAPEVAFYLNNERSDRASALEALAALTRQVEAPGPRTPFLQVRRLAAPTTCQSTRQVPREYRDDASLWINIELPMDGIDTTCHSADVFFDDKDQIEAIVVRTRTYETASPDPTPTANTADGKAIAEHFLEFSRGFAGPPKFGDEVRLYLNNAFVKSISADEAADLANFVVIDECTPDPESDCPRSGPEMILRQPNHAITVGVDECLGGAVDLLDPNIIGTDHRTVMFSAQHRTDCEYPLWAVQLVYDPQGRIDKVDLLSMTH